MLGLVPPDDHGEERRLLLPAARHRHPEHRSGDPTLGVPQLGVVGEVAGEADACLGHGASLLDTWPGGLPCPWTRAAGLDGLRIHDLRHTAVALWIAAGANPKEDAARAGHASVS